MELLLLTTAHQTPTVAQPAGTSSGPLPSLDVLPHAVRTASIESAVQAVLAYEAAPLRSGAILIDGTTDPRAARTAAVLLAGRTRLPRVAILRDSALAALSAEWEVADFFTPETSPVELDVRLRLLTQRAQIVPADGGAAVEVSGVEIDESNFVARVQGRTLDLTYKEFELLHFLALHPARVFTREQLLAEVWGTDYFGGARTVDVHVRRLRAKLGEHELLISTVRGVGYGFARDRTGAQ